MVGVSIPTDALPINIEIKVVKEQEEEDEEERVEVTADFVLISEYLVLLE